MNQERKIYFVGAGPGDPKLLTIKGKELIERADVLVYAGSLVNPSLLEYAKKDCVLHDSAKMNLEEIRQALVPPCKEGKCVVRLASGDPMIFGAVEEMSDLLQEEEITVEIVPGVSSFTAAASALQASLTIPDLTQTVILTRAEGRTKMPPKEKLEDLAKHESTLILFLSAVLAKSVQEKLLAVYPADTPIAIVYKASWPDQKIFRGTLSQLDSMIRREKITMTALIMIGKFLTAHGYKSRLYDAGFSHAFRRASV
ncbi:MAG: precorrin-4 C(11)-methyltransferase [Elusimicrobia bacterium]|nr:precorrin-4 C(11)-methyltransferase [Elusimicrobiota bacterium]